ncbi:MAG: putative CtpA-like serine protease [Candidatus Omnitrophica bacterium ADurb.Bin205]|nr:MAG: putative CtpA-like serine protease [Candidatus Omnitrophica bacterium ADurb.Bin205]
MRKKQFMALGFFALSLFIFVSVGQSFGDKKKKDELYRQISLFSDALAVIQSDYVEETNPKDLIYGALKGMLSSLDMHSQFMDPETYNELKVETKGKFGGLGIEITIKEGMLTVITPIEDTPAWRAGIKPLDRIVKINNEITQDMTLSEAVKRMRGKPGEAVNLTILRESDKKMMEFKIVRGVIQIRDIKEARILENGIAYIKLVQFREDSFDNLNLALNKLSKEKPKALILDLRNNPGGLLDMSVQITGKFIPKGKLVVYTRGRKEEQSCEYFSDEKQPILHLPMAVLINEGSASGSEILAAALQYYKRAIVIGGKSFGKGSVQVVIPLGDGTALKLTTSKYFTPDGKEISGKGVIPDIVLEDEAGLSLQDLPDRADKESLEESAGEGFNYQKDKYIMRAVDLLKALNFYQQELK